VPQPFWHVKGAFFREIEVKFLGIERAEKEYPMKSFLDAGVTLASASDYPVQVPSPPLVGIMRGVLRRQAGETDPDEILGSSERMTPADMLASFTINGAYANGIEDETGSIEVGKKADLVVLEKNLFDIPAEQIGAVPVLMTLFEGRTVYRDPAI
jgi:predicted amidohydrolase YtcJ